MSATIRVCCSSYSVKCHSHDRSKQIVIFEFFSSPEDPDPGGMESKHSAPSSSSEGSPSSSESIQESSSSSSLNPSPMLTRGLSRRQRKNRKRDNINTSPAQVKNEKDCVTSFKSLSKNEETKKKVAVSPKHKEPVKFKQNKMNYLLPPLEHFLKLTMTVDKFIQLLKEKYLLRREDMAMLSMCFFLCYLILFIFSFIFIDVLLIVCLIFQDILFVRSLICTNEKWQLSIAKCVGTTTTISLAGTRGSTV